MHAQNSALRRIQNRGRHQGTEHTAVGDGKGSARHFIHGQFSITGLNGQFFYFSFNIVQHHHFRIADYGNHKSLRCAHGNAHIHVVVKNLFLPVDNAVHRGKMIERLGYGLGKETHEPEIHPEFFFEFIPVLFAYFHQRTHVYLVEGGEHGGFIFYADEALRNFAAKGRHFLAFFFACALPSVHGCCLVGKSGRHELQQILFGDATAWPGSGHLGCRNILFSHHFGRSG